MCRSYMFEVEWTPGVLRQLCAGHVLLQRSCSVPVPETYFFTNHIHVIVLHLANPSAYSPGTVLHPYPWHLRTHVLSPNPGTSPSARSTLTPPV